MPLTDTAIKQAKPADKEYLLTDGLGLGLLVRPNGKHWVFRYTYEGKRKKMFMGTYPEVSLKAARIKRQEARELLEEGTNPAEARVPEEVPQELLFKDVAAEWIAFRSPRLTQGRKGSAAQARRYMDKDILPALGEIPIKKVTRSDLLKVVRSVESRGALNVAEKVRTWLNQLFRYAIVHEYVEANPATDMDIVAAEQPPVTHNPWLEFHELGQFVRDLESYKGTMWVKLGVRLLLLTCVRTAELRQATHDQFDLEKGVWMVPALAVKQLVRQVREKGDEIRNYAVPLSTQAIEIVRELQQYSHTYPLLIPGRDDPTKPISENTLNGAIKRMGYGGKLTGHGIRGTISTGLYELNYPEHLVESQLSHASTNQSKVAYNHAMYVEQRREMMQSWADLLDHLAAIKQPYDERSIDQFRISSNGLSEGRNG